MPNTDAESARQNASQANRRVLELEERLERALLACETLWCLVSDKLEISPEEFIQKMNEIDLKDGVLDGKLKMKAPIECQKCHRTVSAKRMKCIYCGETLPQTPFV
ncbi:MAG: hypothetical protein JNK65_07500 [Deltaproteobacteria bacterium]|nr:hypothetical protein [Deltaproteobacteria bacterium]